MELGLLFCSRRLNFLLLGEIKGRKPDWCVNRSQITGLGFSTAETIKRARHMQFKRSIRSN